MGQSTKRKEMELRKEVLEHVFRQNALGCDYEKSAEKTAENSAAKSASKTGEKSDEKSQSTKRKTQEDHAIETGLCTCTEYCKECRKRDVIRAWYKRKQEDLKKKDSKYFELEKPKKSKISIKAWQNRKKEALNKGSNDFELEEPNKKKYKVSEDDVDDDLNSWTCQIELY